MKRQNCKILLLADNAPTHLLDETIQLSNIKVYFLPPNTTAHLQPLDAGIINSFKAQYRKLLVANRVETYDLAQKSGSNITPVDILDAITFVSEAWNIVKSKLQEMIDELNLQDSITAERFIHIDDKILIELLSDEEIIAAIISRPENDDIEEDDESETNISISNKEALSSLEKVVQYFKNPPDNILVDYTELKTLNALKSKINKQIQDNAKQTTLDSFMQH
ncbi:hypothetical protein RirG_244560 [Rhizophagus irregularis DAOM 197198w]|uniref:DDE-1 domain-containing protein n=1 Tax=Rhizophagus irregularis (strain DAOM 197198w) TaxID=1432141 RepID=A0A015K1R2_RHIIW|nr:hypothetical protein RirG_244560 [Rhizophagus irregularis DAOM 197198w]